MSHHHDRVMFDRGAVYGLESYCRERQGERTVEQPGIVGYLSAAAYPSAFNRGLLHGLALGAKLHFEQIDFTMAGRS